MVDGPARPTAVSSRAPVNPNDIAPVRTQTLSATTLPARVYHDPDIFAWEREKWFAGGWNYVGREIDLPAKGSYFLTEVAGEAIIVVRGTDGEIRAFFNVCRHRGSRVVTEQEGQLVRFQCPYHAWIYDLDGKLHNPRHTDTLIAFDPADFGLNPARLAIWQGFIFLNVTADADPLEQTLGSLPEFFARFDLARLTRAERIEYDVQANWKILVENYSECYHCPGVHPQLNRITPYNLGEWLPSSGSWSGSWMPVVGEYETLSIDGHTNGRAALPGMTEEDHKRVYYFIVWPNLLMSMHPDYLMVHRIVPIAPDRSYIVCDWFFDPDEMAKPDFDPSDAVEFWDLTNRQDWQVCELQQTGTRSRAFSTGRYSAIESGPHLFAARVADGYAADGVVTDVTRVRKTEGSARDRAQTRATGGS
jgi:Rieske 2Fe-2S family protein